MGKERVESRDSKKVLEGEGVKGRHRMGKTEGPGCGMAQRVMSLLH